MVTRLTVRVTREGGITENSIQKNKQLPIESVIHLYSSRNPHIHFLVLHALLSLNSSIDILYLIVPGTTLNVEKEIFLKNIRKIHARFDPKEM